MMKTRLAIATTLLLVLLSCTGAPAPSGPNGGAPLPSPGTSQVHDKDPLPQRNRRDLVSTIPEHTGWAWDLMVDNQDRLYTVAERAITRFDADGKATVVAASNQTIDGPREQKDRELFHPMFGALAPDGTLYALGLLNRLYKVAPNGNTLASYAVPHFNWLMGADVALDSKGNVYVTMGSPDYGPDKPGRAWIAKLSSEGALVPFAGDPSGPTGFVDGTGTAARFNGPSAIAIDALDNLYIADRGNLSIRRITPQGVVTTVVGKGQPQLPPSPMPGQPSPDLTPFRVGTVPIVAITVTRAGDLFYATSDNRIWRITPDGEASHLAGSGRVCQGPMACVGGGDCPPPPPPDACYVDGPGLEAEFNGIQTLVATRDGTLYALDGRNTSSDMKIRRIDWVGEAGPSFVRPGPLAVRTTREAPAAPSPVPSMTPTPAFTTPSCPPEGPCAETAGRVYDAAGQLVKGDVEVLAAIAGHPDTMTRVGSVVDGTYRITTPSANQPIDLIIRGASVGTRRRPFSARRGYDTAPVNGAADPRVPVELDFGGPATSGDPDAPAYYMPGQGREVGYELPTPLTTFETSTVTTVAGTGRDETFNYVSGLGVRPNGEVVVASQQNNSILAIAPSGATSILAGGPYDTPYGNEQYLLDGRGRDAHFYSPSDVALDAQGNAYIADTSNSAIRKITPEGVVTTLAGRRPYGYAEGLGTAALFWGPRSIAVDRAGTVYVADTTNHCIRAITPDGQVSTYAGTNAQGYVGGPRSGARFRTPTDLAFGPDGSLYVADSGNYRIRRISPDGVVSDAYGFPTNAPDGTARLPVLSQLTHLVLNSAGDLFTAQDERVYRIRPTGAISILAGYGLSGFADGNAQNAYFAGISGLGIDDKGTIYVSDYGNLRVRKITSP